MKSKVTSVILPIGILLLAAFFRLYGLNWDQNQHLHPDERFLTMVSTGIEWPNNLSEYLNTDKSPLNPHNRGFGFFVYGTFPVFFTKFVAESLNLGNYGDLTLVGRFLSALTDLATVLLVFFIAKKLAKLQMANYKFQKKKPTTHNLQPTTYIPFLAMLFYASSVLAIQLSHYYAVDTYLTFFITLSFYLLVKLTNSKHKTRYNTIPDLGPNNKKPSSIKHQITNKRILKNEFFENRILLGNWNFRLGIYSITLGIAFGLALASKISGILFLPLIGITILFVSLKLSIGIKKKSRSILNFIYVFFLFIGLYLPSAYVTIRLSQPYLFSSPSIFNIALNPKVLDNWKQLKAFSDPNTTFPPSIQWIKTKPFFFPVKNMILWGLGLPLGVITTSAIFYRLTIIGYQLLKRKLDYLFSSFNFQLNLIMFWILLLFIYQSIQFAKPLRYFLPIYPFLAIISSWFIYDLIINLIHRYKQNTPMVKLSYYIIGLFVLIYPISFMSIYSKLHTRVQASEWIYKNIPPGSYKSNEHWDDGLPISLPNPGFIHEKYNGVEFPLYGTDTIEKWKDMDRNLRKVDYIILTSNRLYGSIMTMPERFPITFRYYQMLFNGNLGFQKIAEFTSRPNIPLPFIKLCLTPPFSHYGFIAKKNQDCSDYGISFVDDYADETFTVYDHPKVIIFQKVESVDYFKILYNLEPTTYNLQPATNL